MKFVRQLSLSVPLILFFILHTFSESNPNANQKSFNGDCTDSYNQCQHVCKHFLTNPRQFYCTCRSGYFIQNDGFSCNETPPNNMQLNYEIIPGSSDEKSDKFIPQIPITVRKSTRKIVTREKRFTDGKSKTQKPIKGLPKGKCTVNSCKNGGVCQTMKSSISNDFVISCLCRLGYEGLTCEKATAGVQFPKFLNGYLAFPEQILNDLDFRLSLIIRPGNDSQADPVIAFKQSLKNNKFILGLEQNQFVFRIESSKVQIKLRHQTRVEFSKNFWYKIEIERKDKKAKLTINDVESTFSPIEDILNDQDKDSEFKNDNNLSSDNFICDYCLYLGGHPQLIKTVQRNANLFGTIENSYIGCIRNLMIDDIDIDMRRMPFYGKAVEGLGIDDCSAGLCDPKPNSIKCFNDGDCHVSRDFSPVCRCRFGYTGPKCEQSIAIKMPSFNGESYAIYNGLMGTSRSQNDIFIKFKPISATGILLYQGYSSDKRGDFLALYLINGHPWVSFDLGSGTISLRSHRSLKLDEWHTIRFYRVGRKGTMIIDYNDEVFGFSPGPQVQLTIKQYLQLGGVDSFDNVSAYLSIRKGFQGCIQMLFIDHHEVNLIGDLNVVHSRNLLNCDTHQCAQFRRICWEDGACVPDSDLFSCSCPLGYIEEYCQTKIDVSGIRQPSFNGSSYLVYTDSKLLRKFINTKFHLSLTMNIKVNQMNRILLHLFNKTDMGGQTFVSFKINANIGIDMILKTDGDAVETTIFNNLPLLSDHKIQITKDRNVMKFFINDSFIQTFELKDKNPFLKGFSTFLLGGTDVATAVRLNLPVQSGIIGCIKEFVLDNQIIRVVNANDGRTVAECSSRYSTNRLDIRSHAN